ncbi:M15 family metallopeptidase [Chungangia koreensis]|uniref:M15 family metallopeptidase n=1 Tax=Chungangia koreensis TaxID=752657 RepID=A0ABV8X794_9LACT
MKKFLTWLNILFLIVLGGFIFIYIQNEWEFREELKSRPLPKGLHPIVAEKSGELVRLSKEQGIEITITDGFRSIEEQNQIYRQGRSNEGNVVTYAKGGQSYHNFGLAIDFALSFPDGSVSWDMSYDGNGNGKSDWHEVAAIGKELGFEWGGDWRSFKDYPHLQMTFGLSLGELQEGWRPEDTMEKREIFNFSD